MLRESGFPAQLPKTYVHVLKDNESKRIIGEKTPVNELRNQMNEDSTDLLPYIIDKYFWYIAIGYAGVASLICIMSAAVLAGYG